MHNFERYCKDYENIENYQKAKADNFFGWECHHRLETHNSDGERRLVDISAKELAALGMYYNRPAKELIFMTISEHNSFRKGKKHKEETKNKISEAKKGKHLSEEHKKKMSDAKKGKNNSMYGKKHSDETRKKIGETHKGNTYTKGMHWYHNDDGNIMAKECLPGFEPGMLRK